MIDKDEKHKYQDIKRNAAQEKEYQSFLSKKILEQNIINIAQAYSNVPEIYFPVTMDFRGRINVVASTHQDNGSI